MYCPPLSASPNKFGMLTENLLFRKHLLSFSRPFPGIHSRVPHFSKVIVCLFLADPSTRNDIFGTITLPRQNVHGPCSLVVREFKALRGFISWEMSMRKLGVGVLGVGEMGKRHAENLRRLVPEARLAAVADAFPERARQVANELEIDNSYGSLEAMLERKEVDAVLIATPD